MISDRSRKVCAGLVALLFVLPYAPDALAQYTYSRRPEDYRSAWITQNAYPTLQRGESYRFSIQFRNVGSATWHRGVVNLGTDRSRDRIPGFIREDRRTGQPSGWISGNRVALQEVSVPPGGIGTFVFWYTVPHDHASGTFREYFRPVADGITWMDDCGCHWDVTVVPPPPTWGENPQPGSRQAYKGFSWGYCTWYAAIEFDKMAGPGSPGVNWRGNAQDWYFNAAARGWKVTSNPKDVIPGSLAVWRGGGFGHLAIVRSVAAGGFGIVEVQEMNWGRPTDERNGITENFGKVTSVRLYSSNMQRGSYQFIGYIHPR